MPKRETTQCPSIGIFLSVTLTIFERRLSGIRHTPSIVQPPPPSTSKPFHHCKQTLCTHEAITPVPSAPSPPIQLHEFAYFRYFVSVDSRNRFVSFVSGLLNIMFSRLTYPKACMRMSFFLAELYSIVCIYMFIQSSDDGQLG